MINTDQHKAESEKERMKILIDISEDTYREVLRRGLSLCPANEQSLVKAIKKGIQLPKGHGRLIDADETLKKHCVDLCREKPSCYEDCLIYDLFHLAPTIIEADKEEEQNDKERSNK